MNFYDCTKCKHFVFCESGKQIFHKISQIPCIEFEEAENGKNEISETMPTERSLPKVKEGQI